MKNFTDSLIVEEMEEAHRDPRFAAYHAGFEKAKEIYSKPNPAGLSYITSSIDHFMWWKESQP